MSFRQRWHSLEEELAAHQRLAGADGQPAGSRDRAPDATREATRDQWRWHRLDDMARDFRLATRGLMRRPGFALAATLTLGLGLGCAAAVFGLCYAVLWEPLPYAHANRLVEVRQAKGAHRHLMNSGADVLALRAQGLGLEGWALYRQDTVTLVNAAGAERVAGAAVEPQLLRTLGARPLVGRLLSEHDAQPGSEPVVLISRGLWRRRWGGRTDIIGQMAQWEGVSRRIVGVLPDWFDYPLHRNFNESWLWLDGWVMRDTDAEPVSAGVAAPSRSEFWLPLGVSGAGNNDRSLASVALLAPGAGVEQAQQRLDQAMRARALAVPADADWRFRLTPMRTAQAGNSRPGLLLMLTVAGLLLAVAAANFLGLFKVRLQRRARELATRVELGASRNRIARLLGAELACLGVLAVLVGLGLASLALAWLRTHAPADLARLGQAGVNGPVVALLLLGAALCLLPPMLVVLASRWDHAGRRPAAARRFRPRTRAGGLSVQVALSFVLVTTAGLLAAALWGVTSAPLGFEPGQVLRFEITPLATLHPDSPARQRVYTAVATEVARLPGVQSVASALYVPFQAQGSAPYALAGQVLEGRDARQTMLVNPVSADYLTTLRIPVRAGRGLLASDTAGAPRVAVLSAAAARRLFPGRSPLGERVRFRWDGVMDCTVVGVAGDVRSDFGIPPSPPEPIAYMAAAQDPVAPTNLIYVARVAGDPAIVARQLAAALARWDATLPGINVGRLADDYAAAVQAPRFRAGTAIGLAGLALLLTVIGLYVTLAYRVRMRTSELAVRLAIGARPAQVRRMVLGQSLWLLCPGMAAGLLVTPLLGRYMRAQIGGMQAVHPVVLAGSALLLLLAGLAAAWVPSRRAMLVDAATSLRHE